MTPDAVDPGRAAALVAGLIDELAGADDTAGDVHAYRARRSSPLGAALGALVVPVSRLGGVLDALDADPRSEPLDLVLVADTGLVAAAEARAVLLDDDRVELRGLHVSLPADGRLDDAARLTLESLDFALPAWVAVPLGEGWEAALDVLAADGAERALLRTRSATPEDVGRFVVACVHRGLPFSAAGGPWPGGAVAGLLAATSAALDGRDEHQAAALLGPDAADAALAVLADCDARAVRRALVSVGSHDVAGTLAGLVGNRLLAPDLG
jgi:hypothetical protein